MTRDDRRNQIVEAAADLFDRSGYAHTSMDELAKVIGIAKPTLYHYFSSKDEILLSIHEEFIDILLHRQGRRAAAGLPPEQEILEIMVDILELMETHRGHVRVFFEHHRELPAEQRREIRKKRDRYEEELTSALEAGIAAGTLRGVDPHLAALGLFGMCNWAYQWYRSSGPLRPREIAFQLWDMMMRGIDGNARGIALPE